MAQFVLRLNHFVRAISFIAIVVGYSAEPAYADAALIARGHTLATNRCGRCHAIGKTGEASVLNRRPSATFRAGIHCRTYRSARRRHHRWPRRVGDATISI